MATTPFEALQQYLARVGDAYAMLVDATTKVADRRAKISNQEAPGANNENRELAETIATYIQETAAAAAELGRAWAGLRPAAETFVEGFETSVKTPLNPSAAPREERTGAAPAEDVAPRKARPQCPRCGKQFVGPAQLAHHERHADRLCTPA